MNEAVIRELCHQYTDLEDAEIQDILNMSMLLPAMADLEEADMFIDCPMIGGDALVVGEAKPTKVPSAYKKTVVGLVAAKENEPAVARTFRLGIRTRHMKATTQELGVTIQSVEPIWSKYRKKVIGVLIREKLTTEDLEIKQKVYLSDMGCQDIAGMLSNMNDESNWLAECIDEALIMVNAEGIITFRNRLAQTLFKRLGYMEDVEGKYYADVRLSDEELDQAELGSSYEEILVGHQVVSERRIPLAREGMGFAILLRDITKQKEQEKELVVKSAAIREMHHRIKNSLQIIASLLRLQIRRSDSREVQNVLSESMLRIESIANTHQLLSRELGDAVQLRQVLTDLKNNALRAYCEQTRQISISLEGDDFKVESDIATSIALIVNELVQNAIKYAFQEGESGNIRIIASYDPRFSQIMVCDDGRGYEANEPDSDGLGMMIVRTMVEDKLQGSLDVKSDQSGTRVTFRFLNKIMSPME